MEIKVYDSSDALIADKNSDGIYQVGTSTEVANGTHDIDGSVANNLIVKVIDTSDNSEVTDDGAHVGPNPSPIKIEVHTNHDQNGNFIEMDVVRFLNNYAAANAVVSNSSAFLADVQSFNLTAYEGTGYDTNSYTAITDSNSTPTTIEANELSAGSTHVYFELTDPGNSDAVVAGNMVPVADQSGGGGGGGGGGSSTATGSIQSIVKSGDARLDVQFTENLVKDNANLEAGGFAITGAGGITVTSAEYTQGLPIRFH